MAYRNDPAEIFKSDVHRRVLGHLSPPGDAIGWSPVALLNRMIPDSSTHLTDVDELLTVLGELEADGHAVRITAGDTEVWQMSQAGFDSITGSIANEPPPGAAVQGPAMIGGIDASQVAATVINPNDPDLPQAPATEEGQ